MTMIEPTPVKRRAFKTRVYSYGQLARKLAASPSAQCFEWRLGRPYRKLTALAPEDPQTAELHRMLPDGCSAVVEVHKASILFAHMNMASNPNSKQPTWIKLFVLERKEGMVFSPKLLVEILEGAKGSSVYHLHGRWGPLARYTPFAAHRRACPRGRLDLACVVNNDGSFGKAMSLSQSNNAFLDYSSWSHPTFRSEGIRLPTLRQVVERLQLGTEDGLWRARSSRFAKAIARSMTLFPHVKVRYGFWSMADAGGSSIGMPVEEVSEQHMLEWKGTVDPQRWLHSSAGKSFAAAPPSYERVFTVGLSVPSSAAGEGNGVHGVGNVAGIQFHVCKRSRLEHPQLYRSPVVYTYGLANWSPELRSNSVPGYLKDTVECTFPDSAKLLEVAREFGAASMHLPCP